MPDSAKNSISIPLKELRVAHGITQAQMSEKTGIHQPNISNIENGKTDPSFSLVEDYLSKLDLKLVPVSKKIPDVQYFVDGISEAVEENKEQRAFRIWAELDNRLRTLDGTEISVALANPVHLHADDRYNAITDGLFEYHLNSNRAPLPRWMRAHRYSLTNPWYTAGPLATKEYLSANSPEEFYDRNVFLHWSDLTSV